MSGGIESKNIQKEQKVALPQKQDIRSESA
jgi:hypothetical protein